MFKRSAVIGAFVAVVSAESADNTYDANGALEAEQVVTEQSTETAAENYDANGALESEAVAVAEQEASPAAEKPELNGEVLVGKGDNYEQWVNQFEYALVEFMAPWCGHCKTLKPEYAKAAKLLHEQGLDIPLVEVDATDEANQAGAQKYDIKGFPTLKFFTNGVPSDYDGPREAEGIVDWIKSMTGPVLTEGEPSGSEKLAVAFHGEDASVFEEVAKANRMKATWFHVKSAETKIVLKHAGDDAIESTEAGSKEEIESFFKNNTLPKFGELNGETFGNYMDAGKGLVWALPKVSDKEKAAEEVNAELRETFTKVGSEVGSDFNVAWVNSAEFAQVIENMFGLKEDQLPAVVVQLTAGAKKNFIYSEAMEADKIAEYVNKAKTGEVQPHLKSEEVPEEPQTEPVKVIVGKTVESKVFTEDKDVLLEIYAPWCGHCKKLDPEYLKVAKKVEKEQFDDILTIAKIDGTLNDSPVDALEWSGFPTIYYVKAGEAQPVQYDGPRDAKGIWKWIKKNHSKADIIKERIAAKKAAKKASEETTEAPEEAPAAKEEL